MASRREQECHREWPCSVGGLHATEGEHPEDPTGGCGGDSMASSCKAVSMSRHIHITSQPLLAAESPEALCVSFTVLPFTLPFLSSGQWRGQLLISDFSFKFLYVSLRRDQSSHVYSCQPSDVSFLTPKVICLLFKYAFFVYSGRYLFVCS